MKYKLLSIIFLSFFLIIFVSPLPAFSGPSLKIGIYENPPLVMKTTEGKYEGFVIDILNSIARNEGWKITYVYGTWENVLSKLNKGEIDIFGPIVYSDERAKIYDFNKEMIISNWGQIYAQRVSKLESILDLDKKRIAVLKNDIYYIGENGLKAFSTKFHLHITFVEVNDYSKVFSLISKGKVDAGLATRLNGIGVRKRYKIKETPIVFKPVELFFALPKGKEQNQILIKKIDVQLEKMKKDQNSIYYTSMTKWLTIERERKIWRIVKWTGLAIFIVFLLALIIIYLLKRKIEEKTRELKQRNNLLFKEIRARERTEEILKKEEERFRIILKSIGDGVIVSDKSGNIIYTNKSASKITGYCFDEIMGKNLSVLFKIKGQESLQAFLQKVLKANISMSLPDEAILIDKDNREKIIKDSISPLRNKNSQIIGIVLVFRDITEERVLEKEAEKIQKIETLSLLAGGIAHDFNNLLTSIIGKIDLALFAINAGNVPKNKIIKYLEDAEFAAKNSTSLTKQLLSFSKDHIFSREIVYLNQTIKNTAQFMVRGKNTKIIFSIMDNLWPVYADSGQISQVIGNIVLNASQAMPDGGTIKVSAKNILLSGKEEKISPIPGEYIEISIKDEGIGISDEVLPKIFDLYFTTKSEGNGLGLAMSWLIIKKHNGYIKVDSLPGAGTTFHIYLPVSTDSVPKPIKEKQKVGQKVNGNGRILVMDDDKFIRDTVYELLKSMGYESSIAKNSKETIELYKKAIERGEKFDCVILDLTIVGGPGGEEAVKKLREIDPDICAILSSGYAQKQIIQHYREYGFRAFISKPYTKEELYNLLKDVLYKK